MGTNYYWHENGEPCQTCGRYDDDRMHIGKSSEDWVFSLHVYPEKGIYDLSDWVKILLSGKGNIVDEYGSKISFAELMRIITKFHLWTHQIT